MSGQRPDDPAALRAETEALAVERRWTEIRDRLADLDDQTIAEHPRLAFQLAEALTHLGDMERALTLALTAESEFRARHDGLNLRAALNLAGAVQFELGDLTGAEDRFAALLELAREAGDEEMTGRATNNLGAIATLRGDHERALSLYRLAVPAYQKVGFTTGLIQVSHNLGIVYRELGYWREASRHYLRALNRARGLGDRRLAAMAQVGRAEISHRRGDHDFAEAEANRALEAFDAMGDELGRADALKLLGAVAAARGNRDRALELLQGALAVARAHANPLLEAEVLEERGRVHTATGRTALARADLEVAAGIYGRLHAASWKERAERALEEIG